jgi:hypothetical protein
MMNNASVSIFYKEEFMKNSYLIVVLTLTCLFGLGISARAQDAEGVRVTVPFEFIAGGTTLPAGTYTVGRVSLDASSSIVIRSYRRGAFALPMAVDGTAPKQLQLSFEHVGDAYFLSEVDTPAGVYTFALPPAMVALAQVKYQSTMSSSGTN